MMGYSLEPCFKLYDDSEGVLLEVGVNPDFPDIILLHTPNKESKEFYGDVRLSLSKEQASYLADALLRQIELMNELEDEK
jgi:hypothetical protein